MVFAAVDALGVGAQEDGDAVAGAAGDFGGVDAGVEPLPPLRQARPRGHPGGRRCNTSVKPVRGLRPWAVCVRIVPPVRTLLSHSKGLVCTD